MIQSDILNLDIRTPVFKAGPFAAGGRLQIVRKPPQLSAWSGVRDLDRIWNSAFALLVLTGALLGLTLPFGKIAAQGGVPPLLWTFVFSFGAACVLAAALAARGHRFSLSGRLLRYYVITAAISYAVPNFLIFTVMPHLGAGYTGIMYTLSPALTLLMSITLGIRRPNGLGILGILVGFIGSVMVAVTRGEMGQPAEQYWVALALLIPVLLAAGNIYRTYDWPEGADPVELAVGSHFASAAMLMAAMLFQGDVSFSPLASIPFITLAQIIASAAMFAFYFRLQAVGGPVYLSQIGYVGAGVGLLSGTMLLGERYQMLTWAGAAVIVAGVAMTTRAQAKS
jgi:drug/metabolite transporter (DMT)-like permease